VAMQGARALQSCLQDCLLTLNSHLTRFKDMLAPCATGVRIEGRLKPFMKAGRDLTFGKAFLDEEVATAFVQQSCCHTSVQLATGPVYSAEACSVMQFSVNQVLHGERILFPSRTLLLSILPLQCLFASMLRAS